MRTETSARGNLAKTMLAFVGPFMLSMIVQNLYGAVDLLVVGHFATTADVSAVTIGSQVLGMVTQLVIGFATGTTVLMGKYYGASQPSGMRKTVGTSVILFAGFAGFLTAVLLLAGNPVVSLMQTPPAAMDATRAYLTVCTFGIPFIVGYNVVASMLMGMGNTRTPFLFVCVACAINVVLDITLVRGFGMGAFGAAIATSAAQAGSLLFSLWYLRKRGLGFRFTKADLRVDKETLSHVVRTGAPVAMQNALVGVSFLFITAVINQMGLTASAAVGIVEKSISFLMMPAVSFGAAVATISAQNLGAGEPERARQSVLYGVGLSLVPSLVVVLFCQFGGALLTGLFSGDAAVVATAAQYLQTYVWDVVLVCFVFCLNGYFNSAGYSWFTLLHSLLTTFLIRVPVSWALSRIPGVTIGMLGWAAPLSTVASLFLCLWFMRRLRRAQPAKQV